MKEKHSKDIPLSYEMKVFGRGMCQEIEPSLSFKEQDIPKDKPGKIQISKCFDEEDGFDLVFTKNIEGKETKCVKMDCGCYVDPDFMTKFLKN